jgi:hypothetical protein
MCYFPVRAPQKLLALGRSDSAHRPAVGSASDFCTSRCLGRCQAGEVQPSVLRKTRRCPLPKAHQHGSQLTVTRPGTQGCPFRHSSG